MIEEDGWGSGEYYEAASGVSEELLGGIPEQLIVETQDKFIEYVKDTEKLKEFIRVFTPQAEELLMLMEWFRETPELKRLNEKDEKIR